MCLLTFLPENVDFDYERARVSAQSNPDGFGFAIHAGVAIVKDHDMDFEKLWLRWIDLRKTYRGPALFHFRIATHGNNKRLQAFGRVDSAIPVRTPCDLSKNV